MIVGHSYVMRVIHHRNDGLFILRTTSIPLMMDQVTQLLVK